ncbi:sigma-54-dependent Fis family transcriptional regulator [bacterium]|nr:sigma-54-dependent Fis family transcriptional regulator [bacterium]
MPDTLDLWRQASLHPDLGAFVTEAATWLEARVPLRRLEVWRLRRDGRAVVPVGAGSRAGGPRELDLARAAALADWIAGGAAATWAAAAGPPPGPGAVWRGAQNGDGPALAVPVPGEPGASAALLIVLRPDAPAVEEALAVGAALAGPLAAALENDRRLRELQALRRAAEADRASLLTRLGRSRLDDAVVGADGGLAAVMQRVEMVAGSDLPVLILGETGSGKEVIARAVHARSRRATGPFTRVNCGAIAPELVDSELFGHEKGAFTGAVARRRGWFEQSDRGTLLLDEVGDLPKAAQVRLLRVLQDGLVTRVGGEEPVGVDVRVIAATNADLPGMVQRGAFRADLWYRLAVFPLVLPPLRERTQDIPQLVAMLVLRASRHFGLRPPAATATDLALLASYDWPGNVRELGSVIDRAVILGGGRRLEVAKALGAAGAPTMTGAAAPPGPATAPAPGQAPVIAPLDEAMARHIGAALAAAQGRIEGPYGAARLLRINPHTLRARMRKLGIDWKAYRPAAAD